MSSGSAGGGTTFDGDCEVHWGFDCYRPGGEGHCDNSCRCPEGTCTCNVPAGRDAGVTVYSTYTVPYNGCDASCSAEAWSPCREVK